MTWWWESQPTGEQPDSPLVSPGESVYDRRLHEGDYGAADSGEDWTPVGELDPRTGAWTCAA